MTRAARVRTALRRSAAFFIAVLMLPVLLAVVTPYSSVAEGATVRTGNLWTVTPGAANEIQPAIDAARDNGGGRVRLPAGVYLLTAKVRIHNNVTLYGDGMDQTILRWAPGATIDHMMSNGSTGSGNTNFQVWGLTLDGQNKGGCDDGCHGLRLIHVDNAYIVNVAVINHTLDGMYLGYTHQNGTVYGVNNVRISGCRANSNARNGIAMTHGDANVIDSCQVNGNNKGEAVAGIDLEPDEGLVVNNNKLISNSASGQNVGIQLFEANNDYATMFHNAVCYNTTTGNNAGIFSFRGDQNIFVGNNSSGNGVNFEVDDSSLVGNQYAGWCAIGQLPPHPSTINDTPPPSCSPRPQVTVTTQRGTPGTLNVTVTATRPAAAPNNTVKQIVFGQAVNATVEINGQSHPGGNFTAIITPNAQTVQFVVRRAQPPPPTPPPTATVPFTVKDDCGDWNSLVGGGPSAF